MKDGKKLPEIKFVAEREEKLPLKALAVEKTGNRVTYKDLQVPRIVKRTSNLSVEPQYGSDSDFRINRKKNVPQANKRPTGMIQSYFVKMQMKLFVFSNLFIRDVCYVKFVCNQDPIAQTYKSLSYN